MREDLSFEPTEGGFTRRERITESYEIDLTITVSRLKDGRIAIIQRNATHRIGEASIPLTDEQARIIVAELRRVLDAPSTQEGAL